MSDTTYDGTWTLLIGDEVANADENIRVVIEGGQAWDADTPDMIGSFAEDAGTVTLTLPGDPGGAAMQIVARLLRPNRLSGVMNSSVGDDASYSEPCTLSRGLSLWARVPAKVVAQQVEMSAR